MGCNRITLPERTSSTFTNCLSVVGGLNTLGGTALLSAPSYLAYLGFDPNTGCSTWVVSPFGSLTQAGTVFVGSDLKCHVFSTPGVMFTDLTGYPQAVSSEGLIYNGSSGTAAIPTSSNGMVLTVVGGHPQWAAATAPPSQLPNHSLDGVTGKMFSNTQLQYSCTRIQLGNDAGGVLELVNTGNLIVANSFVGLGGLDTGTVAPSTWYYVYIVSNGTLKGLVLSTSVTKPVMPSGYTYYARIGVAWSLVGSVFGLFLQSGNLISLPLTAIGGTITHTGSTQPVNIVSVVPPIVTTVDIYGSCIGLTGVTNEVVSISGDPSTAMAERASLTVISTSYSQFINARRIPVDRTNPFIYTTGAFTPHTQITMSLVGFTIEG